MLNQLENIKLLNQIEKYKINQKKVGGIFILLVPWRDPSHIKTNIYPTYTKDKEKKLLLII